MKQKVYLILAGLIIMACTDKNEPEISGELKKWHKVTLTFNGPETRELDSLNPFLEYRLNVTFSKNDQSFIVPGYFAADGNAAVTSAHAGNKWKVHFSPPDTGEWQYQVSFQTGDKLATRLPNIDGDSGGYMDGITGSFTIQESDKTGNDLRAKGRLQYVDQRYLKFAETGEYFVKAGADAPENLLAYEDFDDTPNAKDLRKSWEPHLQDFESADESYLWGTNQDKGKGLIGAINYLAQSGMNVFSFLTYNIDGDDRNVYPHLLKEEYSLADYEEYASQNKNKDAWDQFFHQDRFDVSKMAQWEKVFEYAGTKGMYLHFKTMETENDHNMDKGNLGPTRKLYFRELIARFGHHLALNWNLGEENTQKTYQLKQELEYIKAIDPYNHLRVFHTYPNRDEMYRPFLGNESELTGLSMQLSDSAFRDVHQRVLKWVHLSDSAGKAWVVAVDEPGDARHAAITDQENPEHDNARMNALWGTFMAGGAGVEWYFGYNHPESDLTLQDWRSRENLWQQSKHTLDFFKTIPYYEMTANDELTDDENDYVFYKEGLWVVYQKSAGPVSIEIADGDYEVSWYNPRTGEFLEEKVSYDGNGKINTPELPDEKDWVVVIKSKTSA